MNWVEQGWAARTPVGRMHRMTAHSRAKNIEKLISKAVEIETESSQDAGAIGYMARAMVQATLPHRKFKGNEFTRVNGNYTMTIMAPSAIGLPFGVVPRLLLVWLTTEAVRTKSRELVLGDSLSCFMRELGLVPTGGRWGSITRLRDQTKRLFSSHISATYDNGKGAKLVNHTVVDDANLWWDPHAPDQVALWDSRVTLSEQFFKEVVNRPVPVDMRAINALKRSPLALDIYTWLTYRAYTLKSPVMVPWALLALQFGSDYKELRNFRTKFLVELNKVRTVYARVSVEPTPEGLRMRPFLTHVSPASRVTVV